MIEENYKIEKLSKAEYDYIMKYLNEKRTKEKEYKIGLVKAEKAYDALNDFLADGGQVRVADGYGLSATICNSTVKNSFSGDPIVLIEELEFYYNGNTYVEENIMLGE